MNPPSCFLFAELFAVVVVLLEYTQYRVCTSTIITSFRKMMPEQQPSNVSAFCFQTQSTAQLAIIQSFVGATVLPLFNFPPNYSGDESLSNAARRSKSSKWGHKGRVSTGYHAWASKATKSYTVSFFFWQTKNIKLKEDDSSIRMFQLRNGGHKKNFNP